MMMGQGGSGGSQGSMRMQIPPTVWLEDENGKLKMVMIRTGVTDNTNTEIVSGELTEGQEIITGQNSSSNSSRRSSNPMRGGNMMFMRR